MTVRSGSVRIQVHRSPKRIGSRVFNDWEFRWRDGAGRRRRLKRARKKDALAEARRIARDLAAGRSAELSSADVASFRAGLVNLCGCGVTIEAATAEYAEARKRLGGAGSVLEAADFFARHQAGGGSDKPIAEVVAELIIARKAAGAGALHLRDLSMRLGHFSAAVKCPIRLLSALVINEWLSSLKLSPRSVRNYRGAIANLVQFSISKKYLPPAFAEMRFVSTPKSAGKEVEIFTTPEMQLLLRHASQSLLPVLVLGGFAGLRTSETKHICWEHVHWNRGTLTVPRGKTGNRVARLFGNTKKWLQFIRSGAKERDGNIVRIAANTINSAMGRAVLAANKATGDAPKLVWKHNALRHSFVTYWSSFEHDLWKISERTGHSVRTLKKHYQRQDVSASAGRSWFQIRPNVDDRKISAPKFRADRKTCPLDAPSRKSLSKMAQNSL